MCETVGVGVGGRAYTWLVNATSFQLLITFLKEVLIYFDISPTEVKYIAVMFYVDLVFSYSDEFKYLSLMALNISIFSSKTVFRVSFKKFSELIYKYRDTLISF